MEEAKINTQIHPNVFGNQLIPLDLLEKNSGSFQINDEYNIIPNLTLLTSSVKPFDQVLELDEEWNYDVLHTEIGQIVKFFKLRGNFFFFNLLISKIIEKYKKINY